MGNTDSRSAPADALVILAVAGGLVREVIFPALYAMAQLGVLRVPSAGMAGSKQHLAQLPKHATGSIKQTGKIDEPDALSLVLFLLTYPGVDYNDPPVRPHF